MWPRELKRVDTGTQLNVVQGKCRCKEGETIAKRRNRIAVGGETVGTCKRKSYVIINAKFLKPYCMAKCWTPAYS